MTAILLVALYWLPTFVALIRRMPNTGQIAVINCLLGWLCGIGWIIALVLACGVAPPRLPPRTRATLCPRCNAAQNIPVGAPTFQCWRCHYVAHRRLNPWEYWLQQHREAQRVEQWRLSGLRYRAGQQHQAM